MFYFSTTGIWAGNTIADMFPRNHHAGWKAELLRMLGLLAAVVVLLGVIALMLIYFYQDNLLYFPTRQVRATPEQIGLTFDDVTLETKDGITINGWFVPVDSPKATILFCHGNAGNIGDRLESIAQFHRLGLAVFIFDYRGYGHSAGRPDEEGTYRDAEAAWDYLTRVRKVAPQTIVVFGRSLGGAIAIRLAAEHRPGALIVESTFTSLADVAARHYPFLPVRLLLRYRYASRETIARVTAPVLIAHSPDDRLVPYRQGEALFAAANEPKEFFALTGSHNEGFLQSANIYEEALTAFIDKYITR
jgi:fermentation-respiration switch protein FrsA (DUF1100 family)